jgi:DNA-3-methyladenine glycosylase II
VTIDDIGSKSDSRQQRVVCPGAVNIQFPMPSLVTDSAAEQTRLGLEKIRMGFVD